jgi:signal transduction histidine kinase
MARLAKGETVDDHPFVYDPPSGGRRDMRGTARALTVLGRPCSIWVIRDVTDQLRLEDQLRQSQKMDAIGQLAAGVAHDFNNLLTVILACTQQAIEDAPNKEMGNRAAALTRQLLVFSRKQALETRLTEVTCLIRDLQAVVRCLMPETAELVWDLPESLPMVLADAGNLEQVIMNLAINARDALPAKGGRIRIGAGLRNFATAEETGHADGRAGEFVTLQVADNGSGIPPEVLPRIFEPFFTTKAVGKGTGLGLSTVYSIARQHRGWIDIDTAVGRGTTFTIYHPVAEPEEAALAVLGDRPRAPMRVSPTGWGRVLAVDDDSEVQSVMRLVFDRCKIDGVIALDAPSAVNAWDACHGAFDMLVTDVVMPNGPTGIDLARALRQRKPDLKVVIMTGYSSELLKPDSLKMPGRPPRVMLKPFDIVTAINTMASA